MRARARRPSPPAASPGAPHQDDSGRHPPALHHGRPSLTRAVLHRPLTNRKEPTCAVRDSPPGGIAEIQVKGATNKTESFNRFSQWIGFGNRGVIADNDPVEQEKTMKFNALLTNAVIFHNALDIAEIVRQLLEEGWTIEPEGLSHISPYLTEHINRFGEYSTHELGIQPEAYDPKLDVDFTPLRDQDLTTAGLGQAA
ncbi:transposase (plasmid) [Streptomyces albidoflavus]|nr:transposase [Streptomyces albidoflavus]